MVCVLTFRKCYQSNSKLLHKCKYINFCKFHSILLTALETNNSLDLLQAKQNFVLDTLGKE